jgi:hypothetical protein
MPKIEAFKGEPKDLERFLQALDTRFELEPKSFPTDRKKILFTFLHLSGDVAKWWEAYRKGLNAVDETPGVPNPYVQWKRFVDSLRSSFGSRLTRQRAVEEWNQLHQKNFKNIDTFLDEVIRLTWRVGYDELTVQDKIATSLNHDLAIEWAKTRDRPDNVHAQIEMVRELGHRLADADRIGKASEENARHGKAGGKNKGKGKAAKKETTGTSSADGKENSKKAEKKPTKSKKDKEAELAKIP